MSTMEVIISPWAAKYLAGLNEPMKSRIGNALRKLGEQSGDVKSLYGRDGYRLRVGKYRILFDISDDAIIVYEIGLRGQIYKGGGLK